MRRALLILLGVAVVAGSGLAGVWFARSPVRIGSFAPLTLSAVVGADAVVVEAGVAGKVRLVAVKEGDTVQEGQLVAWLEAPELRDAVRAAEDAVRDAQRRLERLRSGRPSRAQERLARAEAEATAAQRALENAEEQSREVPRLGDRVTAARTALEEATLQLSSAEETLAEIRGAAPTGGTGGGVALESGGGSASGEEGAGENPAVAQATEAVEKARRRKAAAEEELAEAERRLKRAEQATSRLPELSSQALATAAAAQEARSRIAERMAEESAGETEEDLIRREVRETQAVAAQARSRLREAVVVAPAGGLVERVAVAAGQELADGEAIVTLRRLDPVWAEVTLAADAADRVHRKQKVSLEMASSAGAPVEGEVVEMVPQSTNLESPWTVRVAFPNTDHRLLPGTEVRLTFQ